VSAGPGRGTTLLAVRYQRYRSFQVSPKRGG
jgi:hypothetical protein